MQTPASYNLERFKRAQATTYHQAYTEIKAGKKRSHWMWFVFPQIEGLGYSEMSKRYAIANLEEAKQYLADQTLGSRLVEISRALLEISNKSANEIFGSPDDFKLKSCMTLFNALQKTDPVFEQVLHLYFHGKKDEKTLELIGDTNGKGGFHH